MPPDYFGNNQCRVMALNNCSKYVVALDEEDRPLADHHRISPSVKKKVAPSSTAASV